MAAESRMAAVPVPVPPHMPGGEPLAPGDEPTNSSETRGMEVSSASGDSRSSSSRKNKLMFTTVLFNLSSAVIGIGTFGLPDTAKKSGLCPCMILLAVSVGMVYESSTLIHEVMFAWNKKCEKSDRITSFEGVGFVAFGSTGQVLATICNMVFSFGMCTGYIIQVGDLTRQITGLSIGPGNWDRLWRIGFGPIYIYMSMADLKGIEKFSSWAFGGACAAILAIIIKASIDCGKWKEWDQDAAQQPVVQYWPESLGIEFGSAVAILFCAVCIVGQVPAQANAMAEPERFPTAMRMTSVIVFGFYASVVIVGYLAYGNFFRSVTVNMEWYPASYAEAFRSPTDLLTSEISEKVWTGEWNKLWVGITSWCFIPQLIYSYPLFMCTIFCGFDGFKVVQEKMPLGSRMNTTVKVSLILVTLVIAFCVDSLSTVLGLFGAVSVPFTACYMPFAFTWRIRNDLGIPHPSAIRLAWHAVIVVNATCALVLGVIDSVR